MLDMLPSRKPELCDSIKELEAQAFSDQQAIMVRGMARTKAKKTFKSYILGRPKNPFKTMATESMASAIEKNGKQDHGKPGAIVSLRDLTQINPSVFVPVVLDHVLVGSINAYQDGSCIIGYPEDYLGDDERVRICTLPFSISGRQLKQHSSDDWIKVKVRARMQRYTEDGLVVHSKAGEICRLEQIRTSENHFSACQSEHFQADICKEVIALIEQTENESPQFSICPTKIGLKDSDAETDMIRLAVGPSVSRSVSPATYAWLSRQSHSIYDLHLPSISLTVPQLAQVEKAAEAATYLALHRAGFTEKYIPADLHVEAAGVLQGDRAQVVLRQSAQQRMACYRADIQGHDNIPIEKLEAFMVQVSELIGPIADVAEFYGFQFLYKRGSIGSWAPFIPISVCLNELLQDDSYIETGEDVLAKRFEFQMRKTMLMFE